MGNIKIIVFLFLLPPAICKSQQNKPTNRNTQERSRFGIKAGYNYYSLTNVAAINGSGNAGFHVGIFGASVSDKTITEVGELLYSKVGYSYQSGSSIGKVTLHYISSMELANIKLGDQFAIQVGVQLGYLLKAKADSNKTSASTINPYNKTTDYYNRFDYGFAGGIEISPSAGIIIGARYTISISSLNRSSSNGSPVPLFIPSQHDTNLKNNILLIYAGYRF